jgi:hypothetical protein
MKHIIQKAHARLDGMKVPVSQDQKDQKWAAPVLEGGSHDSIGNFGAETEYESPMFRQT